MKNEKKFRYKTRRNPAQKCKNCAIENGYVLFGLLNGGECWAGDLGVDYMKNGRAWPCNERGTESAMAVYKITGNYE